LLHKKTTVIYGVWHRLQTLTAVPGACRSTQPSFLCRMINEYELSDWICSWQKQWTTNSSSFNRLSFSVGKTAKFPI